MQAGGREVPSRPRACIDAPRRTRYGQAMTEGILCIVCLLLLAWVLVLKCRISELQEGQVEAAGTPEPEPDPKDGYTQGGGGRVFKLD